MLFRSGGGSFGNATQSTLAAQVIDPDPQYLSMNPTTSGDHASEATERYRTDAVKKPERQRTSKVGASAGGGSGGQ